MKGNIHYTSQMGSLYLTYTSAPTMFFLFGNLVGTVIILERASTQGILGVWFCRPLCLVWLCEQGDGANLSILVALEQKEVGTVAGCLNEALSQLIEVSGVCWYHLGVSCPWGHAQCLLSAFLLTSPPPLQTQLRHTATQGQIFRPLLAPRPSGGPRS